MIELLITVGIVGILTSVAVPSYKGYKTKVRLSEGKANLSALFKGQASLYQLGAGQVSQGLFGSTGVSQTMAAGCRGPSDNGGQPLQPTSDPVAFDFGAVDACKRLGFTLSGPTYFGYWAFNPPSWGVNGIAYINTAFHDVDGDGRLGMFIERVFIEDGELQRTMRSEVEDETLSGLLFQAL